MTGLSPKANVFSVFLLLACVLANPRGNAQAQHVEGTLPVSTADRLAAKDWWPTRPGAPRDSYAGSAACATCHAEESRRQKESAMGKAASRPSDTLAQALLGEYHHDAFTYRVTAHMPDLAVQVQSGTQSVKAQMVWAVGANVHGQSYLWQKEGHLYEGQLSRFASLSSLDLTPGHKPAHDIDSALGAKLSVTEGKQCAACHMTGSWTDAGLDLAQALPGVQCEACHGPGAAHIRAIRAGDAKEALRSIARPSTFTPAQSIDYCGACHRTSLDVLLEQTELGVGTVRFQPYRLQKSRCWRGGEDARLTCVGCHNPHEPLNKQAASYDSGCLSCHARSLAQQPGPAHAGASRLSCPRALTNCTSCHMPKYTVADMHAQFTDHDIRVVHPGERFPD